MIKRQILEETINNFNTDNIKRFFREANPKFRHPNERLDYQDENFGQGIKLEEIDFEDGNLIVCSFSIKKDLTERTGKKAQYELGKKILNQNQADSGIFIFHDNNGNFRFSLIYKNYLGKRPDCSSFRRFTYFVSPELTNKTFLQRIGGGDFSSLQSIKEAFSVEKVTNKFFDEFRNIFEKTKQEFEKTNKNTACLWLKTYYLEEDYEEQINKFAFTFLGRLIFLYFLMRKGWIENQKNFLRKTVEDKSNCNLYANIFQPLFFDVFAKKENERPVNIKQQYKDTPYLNGGLFEKSNLESAMEKKGIYVLFDDKFIRNIILDFFEAYNFTIDENSPDDQEVSIDPEMLGKVFENTLAEEERGKKGTFYTPREIVHFMVKESIWQFLKNETEFDSDDLKKFIYEDEFNLERFGKEKIRIIDTKLENVKVLDPAVGSAAFPVEMMQVLVTLRKKLNVKVGININEVFLKKQFIKNNLYGVDIDPAAIEIAKLRLWLALIVDYEKSEAEPLPNLDFQFRIGNSLQEKIDDIDIFQSDRKENVFQYLVESRSDYSGLKDRMITIKDKFYLSDNEQEKKKLKKEFDDLEHNLINSVLEKYKEEFESQIKNIHFSKIEKESKATIKKIEVLKQKIKDGTYKLFKPDFHFSEVFDRKDQNDQKIGGFDIVIGNPPYGVKIEDDIKKWHGLGSKDSYGVFISTALKRFLKQGGVLSYIVSDTWLTIKTHKPLREQVLERTLHKIIRVHQDCFEATVNACIISLTNSPDNNGSLIAADLTNISTRKEIEEVRIKLYRVEDFIGQSTPKFAVYEYKQDLIKTNSNLPIFIGSPKLFALMNDTTCKTVEKEIEGKTISVRQITFNGKDIELVRFGDIAEIRQGLATGDNHSYLFQNPEARGSYKNINEYEKYLLSDKDLKKIIENENIRLEVIDKGIHKSRDEENFDGDLWFGGKYIVPYDKGGESDIKSSWLPNYYVPTNYYIDWSQDAVNRMKTLTIKQRDGKGADRICSRFQNKEFYFKKGISFSITGIYAPSFRINSIGVFDVKGSFIEPPIDENFILGLLTSKIIKFISKLFIYDCVDMQVDAIKEIPCCIYENEKIINLVSQIIEKQKQNPRYDYMSNEQKEIDKLVYEMYGLNVEDIREVETWYARRYPKLSQKCDIF